MSYFSKLSAREKRQHMISRVKESVEKGTPEDVIKRYIINEYGYSLSAAYQFIAEAKLLAEPKKRKDGRIES
jgi:hypothetical protein